MLLKPQFYPSVLRGERNRHSAVTAVQCPGRRYGTGRLQCLGLASPAYLLAQARANQEIVIENLRMKNRCQLTGRWASSVHWEEVDLKASGILKERCATGISSRLGTTLRRSGLTLSRRRTMILPNRLTNETKNLPLESARPTFAHIRTYRNPNRLDRGL